jgi:hypothetical protein
VKDVGRYFQREVLSAMWLTNALSVAVDWFYHSKLAQGIGMIISSRSYDSITFLQNNKKTTDFFAESDFSIIFAAEIIICS